MEKSNQKFGIDLFKTIVKDDFDKNVIYSPMSIYFALGMTLCGAKGETLAEMINTLHWNSKDVQSYHNEINKLMINFNQNSMDCGLIKIANKLFLEHSFTLLDSFKGVIKKEYDGAVEMVDFKKQSDQARLAINVWVENQTNGKIKDLLTPGAVHAMTRLIIVNAIYFKGSWQKEFDNCGKLDFHFLNKSTKSVDMISKCISYPYLENKALGFSAVQIPFKMIGGCNYSMMIILPTEKYSLPKLAKTLFEKEWNSVFGKDLFKIQAVDVTMPKFKIESSFNLKDVLQSLGMTNSFSDNADFSLMTGGKDLMIDDVIHKAFIDVDENGVEAAAATAVMMMCFSAMMPPQNPIPFKCDHPFMFALLKEGTLPLFLGHLVCC